MAIRPQVNFPVKKHESDLIEQAQIGLMVRDNRTYTRKDAFLKLCSEFLHSTFAPTGNNKKSA